MTEGSPFWVHQLVETVTPAHHKPLNTQRSIFLQKTFFKMLENGCNLVTGSQREELLSLEGRPLSEGVVFGVLGPNSVLFVTEELSVVASNLSGNFSTFQTAI